MGKFFSLLVLPTFRRRHRQRYQVLHRPDPSWGAPPAHQERKPHAEQGFSLIPLMVPQRVRVTDATLALKLPLGGRCPTRFRRWPHPRESAEVQGTGPDGAAKAPLRRTFWTPPTAVPDVRGPSLGYRRRCIRSHICAATARGKGAPRTRPPPFSSATHSHPVSGRSGGSRTKAPPGGGNPRRPGGEQAPTSRRWAPAAVSCRSCSQAPRQVPPTRQRWR